MPRRSWNARSSPSVVAQLGETHSARVWSASSARRCGRSSSQVTTGHSAAADQRSGEQRPARKLRAGGEAHAERHELRALQQQQHVQHLAPGVEPQDAPRERDGTEGEHRVGERVLAEQHAVAGIDQQAERPAGGQAYEARLAHAPEGEHQRDEIGRQRQVRPGQEVEQQRAGEGGDDGAHAHRQQDGLRAVRTHRHPSSSPVPSSRPCDRARRPRPRGRPAAAPRWRAPARSGRARRRRSAARARARSV